MTWRIRLAMRSAVFVAAVSAAVVPGLTSPAGARAQTPGCSWRAQYGSGGLTVQATDTSAAYWATSFLDIPLSGLTIQGTFPQARYMSFAVYRASIPVTGGHLYDALIQPATGVNPFAPGETGTGTYTLQVVPGPEPVDPAPNTLYAGSFSLGLPEIVYRVYDSSVSGSPEGGVALPTTTYTLDGRPLFENAPCVTSSGPELAAAASPFSPEVDTPAPTPAPAPAPAPARTVAKPVADDRAAAPPEPSWTAASYDGLYPDPDTSSLGATVNALFGKLVVIQAEMPSFPDTNTGDSPWAAGQQVRYWSICENNGLFDIVVACSADYDSVQNDGVATFVISSPANRPANATAADGVNWIPWGSAPSSLIIYRQILADPSFGESIASNMSGGGSLAATMGPYYPEIAYCSEATFASAGAAGCLAAVAPGS
jgi:hypothetical protein